MTDFENFIENFDLVDNALKQRTLVRWNGRDLIRKENLSEHTHLVVANAIQLYDKYKNIINANFETVIRLALIHDSLETLRGDILSITKDRFPKIRNIIDAEEEKFYFEILENISTDERDIVKLADLKACYQFLEWELQNPNNDFAKNAYQECKSKYDRCLNEFKYKHDIFIDVEPKMDSYYCKGYEEDAGIDICINKNVTFMPLSTTNVNLQIKTNVKEGEVAFLFARTSAANKGLSIASCPIDANYSGEIMAIVHNTSNNIIEYHIGESFCQLVKFKVVINKDVPCKKEGKRTNSNLGGTDKC